MGQKLDRRKCISLTKKGLRCRNYPQRESEYCYIHNKISKKDETRCGGITKKRLRCKKLGRVYCSIHQDQDWTGKSCTVVINKQHLCIRIRTSPKFCRFLNLDTQTNQCLL